MTAHHVMTHRYRYRRRRGLAAVTALTVAASLLGVVAAAGPASADVANGALIYQAGNNEGQVNVYRADGSFSHSFPSGMNGGDQFVSGDVDGDGVEELLVLGNQTGGLTIFEDDGTGHDPFGTFADGGDKLAAGDLDGDGKDEIIIAGDGDGVIEVYANTGAKLDDFPSVFDDNDYLAAGDVDGDGREEIVILGDGNGDAYFYRGDGSQLHGFFDTGYNSDDNFALGDINGDGIVEILIAGDVSHKVDVFNHLGHPLMPAVATSYTADDGFAAGDVNGDGQDEILVAGDGSGDIDVYNLLGQQVGFVDNSGFDDDDFLVVGGSRDVDADGIPDQVERFGVRTPDGGWSFRPQDHHASPCQPTVFVKADHMAATTGTGGHTHAPTEATMQLVKDAFARSPRPPLAKCPFPNYANNGGIHLVLLPGEEYPHRTRLSPSGDDDDIYADFSDVRDGTNNNGNNPGGHDRLADPQRPYVHYALWAHKLVSSGDDYGGLAMGKDFVLSLGDNGSSIGASQGQAATFMHELGHTLGLGHGGFESVNFKPNYISLMNYAFPLGLLPGNRLDFSTGKHADLDQSSLDEGRGIGDASVRTGYYEKGTILRYGPGDGPLNYNGNTNDKESGVEVDIDGDNGGDCVSPGKDHQLTSPTAGDDRKAVPPQSAVNPTTVIHAGANYICETDAARGSDGEPVDFQDQPSGTDMRHLKDHDDWARLEFRVRERAPDTPAPLPAELTVGQLEAIVATQDQSVYPDKTLTFGAVPPGTEADAPGVAHDANRIYVTWGYHPIGNPHGDPHAGQLLVLDRTTLRVIKRITVGHEPRSVAVNPVTNKIYVVNYGPTSYSVSVIDGATLTVKATIATGQAPIDVAVNARLNRVYVTLPYQEKLAVINGATDTLATKVDVGPGPTGLAVDEPAGTVYLALDNRSYQPFVNALGVVTDTGVTATARTPVPIPGSTLPRAVTVDQNRIYVGNLGGGGVQPGVTVFDKTSLAITATLPMPGSVRSISADPAGGMLFVSTDRGVHAVNTQSLATVRVMRPDTPMWTVSAGNGLGREFYAGDRTGALTRMSYSSGAAPG
jgi:YVTN family beta-propeller protein